MGEAATLQATVSFPELLRVSGEIVTYRDKPVLALVNRQGAAQSLSSQVSISVPEGSVIQFQTTVATPSEGDVIIDQFLVQQRVMTVRHLGHCWECTCTANHAY